MIVNQIESNNEHSNAYKSTRWITKKSPQTMPPVNRKNCCDEIDEPHPQKRIIQHASFYADFSNNHGFGHPRNQCDKQPEIKINLFFKRDALKCKVKKK